MRAATDPGVGRRRAVGGLARRCEPSQSSSVRLEPRTVRRLRVLLRCAAFAVGFCGLRCCCCCLAGGTCGKRYPTLATRQYALGFRAVKATPVAPSGGSRQARCHQWRRCHEAGQRGGSPPRYAYPLGSRLCVRVSLAVYAVILATAVIVGQVSGNVALTTSMLVSVRVCPAGPRP